MCPSMCRTRLHQRIWRYKEKREFLSLDSTNLRLKLLRLLSPCVWVCGKRKTQRSRGRRAEVRKHAVLHFCIRPSPPVQCPCSISVLLRGLRVVEENEFPKVLQHVTMFLMIVLDLLRSWRSLSKAGTLRFR